MGERHSQMCAALGGSRGRTAVRWAAGRDVTGQAWWVRSASENNAHPCHWQGEVLRLPLGAMPRTVTIWHRAQWRWLHLLGGQVPRDEEAYREVKRAGGTMHTQGRQPCSEFSSPRKCQGLCQTCSFRSPSLPTL